MENSSYSPFFIYNSQLTTIMFDIGFWELCLITVVALLVFGPEKLPEMARSAGLWVGRARRFIGSIKQDVSKELHLEEIRETIQQSDKNGVHEFIEETKTSLSDLKKQMDIDPKHLLENDLSSNTLTPETLTETSQKEHKP